MEKLRRYFAKRGITSTTEALADAISSHSLQAPPVALAKTVAAGAFAKGAAASGPTLTLIKGALKIMAWTKARTLMIAGAVVLLTAGSATVAIREIDESRPYSWQLPDWEPTNFDDTLATIHSVLEQTPAQARIVPTVHPQGVNEWPATEGGISYHLVDGKIITNTTPVGFLGLGMTTHEMVQIAYGVPNDLHTLFATPLPEGRYDFIANLPNGAAEALQSEIKRKLGLVGTWQMVERPVLVLKLAHPEAQGFKPAGSLMRDLNLTIADLSGPLAYATGQAKRTVNARTNNVFCQTTYRFNTTPDVFIKWNALEDLFKLPIIDETGLTNRYDLATAFVFEIPKEGGFGNPDQAMWRKVLADQLGLELVPARRPVQMLMVEKAKD
jgi:hypothetical protein